MNTYSRAIGVFSIAFAFFFMAPAFLSMPFSAYSLMSWGDVFDLFTPLVLIPLYLNLYRLADQKKLDFQAGLPFILLAALWVEGQGMHLAANSIGHLLKGGGGGPAFELTNFYDESLSHYLWHLGIIGLAAIIIIRQWNADEAGERISLGTLGLSSVLYGFTFSAIILEAQTAPLGLPFLGILTVLVLAFRRDKLRSQPLVAFFFGSSTVAIVLLTGWWLYWGELLEPSKWLNF